MEKKYLMIVLGTACWSGAAQKAGQPALKQNVQKVQDAIARTQQQIYSIPGVVQGGVAKAGVAKASASKKVNISKTPPRGVNPEADPRTWGAVYWSASGPQRTAWDRYYRERSSRAVEKAPQPGIAYESPAMLGGASAQAGEFSAAVMPQDWVEEDVQEERYGPTTSVSRPVDQSRSFSLQNRQGQHVMPSLPSSPMRSPMPSLPEPPMPASSSRPQSLSTQEQLAEVARSNRESIAGDDNRRWDQ